MASWHVAKAGSLLAAAAADHAAAAAAATTAMAAAVDDSNGSSSSSNGSSVLAAWRARMLGVLACLRPAGASLRRQCGRRDGHGPEAPRMAGLAAGHHDHHDQDHHPPSTTTIATGNYYDYFYYHYHCHDGLPPLTLQPRLRPSPTITSRVVLLIAHPQLSPLRGVQCLRSWHPRPGATVR